MKMKQQRLLEMMISLLLAAVLAVSASGYTKVFAAEDEQNSVAEDEQSAAAEDGQDAVAEEGQDAAEDGQDSAVPDPAQVVYAIAMKEMKEFREGVTDKTVRLFIDNDEVVTLAADYSSSLEGAELTARIWSVSSMEDSPERIAQLLMIAVNNASGSYGADAVAAATIVRRLNMDNSYPYSWEMEGDRCYFAEISDPERVRAVLVCYFNDDGAIQTSAMPMLGGMTFDFESAYPFMESWKVQEHSVDPLALLVPMNTEKTLDEYMLEMTGRVAAAADPDRLKEMQAPEALLPYCEKCRVFAEEPYAVLGWKSTEIGSLFLSMAASELGETLSSDLQKVMDQYVLSIVGGTMMNSSLGAEPLAAGSLLSVSYAVSGPEAEDTFRWYYYETEDGAPLVCAVNIVHNGNDCYDLSASPVFDTETAARVLAGVRAGGEGGASEGGDTDVFAQLLINSAEEIELRP